MISGKSNAHNDVPFSKARLGVVLFALAVTQVMTTLGAQLGQPWFFWVAVLLTEGTIVAYAWIKRDWLFQRLFLYGVVFGTIELWSDAYYILVGAIEYRHFGLTRILQSPDYMALAWTGYCVMFGYLGILLDQWQHKLWLLVVCALILGVVVPPYNESMAYKAGAWEYLGSPGWQHTPYWIWVLFPVIIVGIVVPIVLLYRRKTTNPLEWVGGASLGAIWLLITSQIAYRLLG
jgi:hypothetical protein